ncbi:MAG: hypothetical protein GY926_05285 [bacterium]|nr:hypothetical protein [bacterium]
MTTGINFSTRIGGLPRWVGGLAAFAYPLLLATYALSIDFDRVGNMADVAASILATMLFLVAAPTAWIFTADFIEAGRLLVVVAGLLTSLPLWYLLGSRLAYFSPGWGDWLRRYLVSCVVWTALNVVLLVLVGTVVG